MPIGKAQVTRIFTCWFACLSLVPNVTFNSPSVWEVREMRVLTDSEEYDWGKYCWCDSPVRCGL